MKRYFYHGFEPYYTDSEAVDHMLEIINSGGIKKRNEAINDSSDNNNLNHICLYRKNESHDYSSPDGLVHSARGGWIDNCMVFVISDEINAEYIPPNTELENKGLPTDLVDEWRCFDNIPLDKIVGLAIPLDSFKNALDGNDRLLGSEEIADLRESLKRLKETCKRLGLKVYNSEKRNFTDFLDSQLENGEKEQEDKKII